MTTQHRAYQKMLRHVIGLVAAIYELVTGQEAPAWRDMLR